MVPLYSYDWASDAFKFEGRPTRRLLELWAKYGVNYDGVEGRGA